MPDTDLVGQLETEELNQFFDQNFLLILLLAAGLVLLYVSAARIVHATVPRALETHTGDLGDGGVHATELAKRSETLESLATTIIRLIAIGSLGIIFIGVFGLWSLLTGLALFLAAVTLAGQSIVLDYLMGVFIVIEGTFFKNDNIEFKTMKGDVEEVGLRRTVIRSPDGTVHSISNGELRVVSNRTRVYASAEVRIGGIREEDLDSVITIAERVGREVADEPAFSQDIMEAHTLRFIENPNDLGIEAVFRGKVVAARRWAVATEMLRRLNDEMLEANIELNKRGVAPRIARAGGGEPPPYVPEHEDDSD